MKPALVCLALVLPAASCSHTLDGNSSSAALDCRHRDKQDCSLETLVDEGLAMPKPKPDSSIGQPTQVELDAQAILRGMNQQRHRQ